MKWYFDFQECKSAIVFGFLKNVVSENSKLDDLISTLITADR